MSPRTPVQSQSSPVRVSLVSRDGPYWEGQFRTDDQGDLNIDAIPSLKIPEYSVSRNHGNIAQKNQPARSVERIR